MTIYLFTIRKMPPFSNAHALITRKIMRSRDAQCNTDECLSFGTRTISQFFDFIRCIVFDVIAGSRRARNLGQFARHISILEEICSAKIDR